MPPVRIGWITDTFPRRPKRHAVWLKSGAMLTMRFRNVALALSRLGYESAFYQRGGHYDVVIIIKTFTPAVLDQVRYLKEQGTPVIFDANVNYYYVWGDFLSASQKPNDDLQRGAKQITEMADHVIADSQFLLDVVRDWNPNATWIPDNVALAIFRPNGRAVKRKRLRLIWSGIANKSLELRQLMGVFDRIDDVELWLVTDTRPSVLDALNAVIPTRWFRYHDVYYAWLLGRADVIISPRQLENSYNLGHTEYKISLGMARGLPAIASPQPSYVSAINYLKAGFICYTPDEWESAIIQMRDDFARRQAMARQAVATVKALYATDTIARQVADIIEKVRT